MPWYMRKPVLASVQGHALGAGCELAMFCDLTIAADDAMFGEPEARYSQAGPGLVMPWIIGFKKARELLYLGDMIDAPTALELGMVNRVVPRGDLSKDTLKFAQRTALIAPEAPPTSRGSVFSDNLRICTAGSLTHPSKPHWPQLLPAHLRNRALSGPHNQLCRAMYHGLQ
jgi:enoyl-CoA hydratase/carnithine racemase